MPHTKGTVLKSSLSFALGRVKVHIGQRFYDLGLTPKMVEDMEGEPLAFESRQTCRFLGLKFRPSNRSLLSP